MHRLYMNRYERYLERKERAIDNWVDVVTVPGRNFDLIIDIAKIMNRHDIDPNVLDGKYVKPKPEVLNSPRVN